MHGVVLLSSCVVYLAKHLLLPFRGDIKNVQRELLSSAVLN